MTDITAVLGSPFLAVLGRAAEKALERRLGKAMQDRAEREEAARAYREAMQAWLVALLDNFASIGFDEAEIRTFFADYIDALERFLNDPEAQDELLRPFKEATPEPRLDHRRLLARWQALGLPDLPDDFNAAGACRRYVKDLNRRRIVTDELRARHQAQLRQEQRDRLTDLVGPRRDLDLVQYAERVRRMYAIIDLSALTPAGRDDPDRRGPRLRDVFVPQHARPSRPEHTLPRDYLKRLGLDADAEEARAAALASRWVETKPEPVLDLLARDDARRAVVLGDPGAGKSTLARYLLLSLLDEEAPARGELPVWRQKLRGRLPILIELRRFVAREKEGKCKGLLGYLHYLGREQGFGLNAGQLDELLKGEPSLLLFDGLDEIFDHEQRERVAREIAGFAFDYPEARLLVTSRIQGFDARPFEEAGFETLTLVDLDDDQIEAFSRGWFEIACADHPGEAEARHRHVMETLKERPAVRALAGNPLLLTIIAIIARHEQLPHSRVGLYEHALGVLCHNWDLRRHVELPADSRLRDLDIHHKLALLRRIAWRMQEGEGLRANVIEADDLRAEIESYFRDDWDFDVAKSRRAAREMIDVLQERNYVLCPQGPGLFGFVHRTFLEYLGAEHLRWRFEKDQDLPLDEIRDAYVLPRAGDDAWHEIIRLLTAQLQPPQALRIIQALTPDPEQALEHQERLSLAFECLAEREGRELARFAPACDRLLDALYAWIERSDLDESEENPLLRVFNQFRFAERVATALRSVGTDWPDPSPLRRGLPRGSSGSPSHQIVVGLCSTWPKDSASYARLRDHARDDPDANVREAALAALAEHFRDDPGTLPLLFERARDDPDGRMRAAALEALAEHFRDDPGTLPLLRERARDDPDGRPRADALLALAQHFRDDPGTLPLLRERARDDPEAWPRSAALRAWAQSYGSERDAVLVWGGLDGAWPGIDPREPIGEERVREAAANLGLSEDEVRRTFEDMAKKFPLRLAWREDEAEGGA